MTSDMSETVKTLEDVYARWSKDTFDMMSKGMSMYTRMSKAWMDVTAGASGEKPEDMLKKWAEVFNRAYSDLFQLYTQPFKMFGTGRESGKDAWEEAVIRWQKMFTFIAPGPAPSGAPDFVNFSKDWFEGYSQICQSWLDSLQKMGDACKSPIGESDKPEAAMGDFIAISDRFMNEWSSFVSEQAKSLFALQQSPLYTEKKETKKSKKEGAQE